jgi:hypothetical protein
MTLFPGPLLIYDHALSIHEEWQRDLVRVMYGSNYIHTETWPGNDCDSKQLPDYEIIKNLQSLHKLLEWQCPTAGSWDLAHFVPHIVYARRAQEWAQLATQMLANRRGTQRLVREACELIQGLEKIDPDQPATLPVDVEYEYMHRSTGAGQVVLQCHNVAKVHLLQQGAARHLEHWVHSQLPSVKKAGLKFKYYLP